MPPQFGDSFLFLHTLFVAELPILRGNTWGGCILGSANSSRGLSATTEFLVYLTSCYMLVLVLNTSLCSVRVVSTLKISFVFGSSSVNAVLKLSWNAPDDVPLLFERQNVVSALRTDTAVFFLGRL